MDHELVLSHVSKNLQGLLYFGNLKPINSLLNKRTGLCPVCSVRVVLRNQDIVSCHRLGKDYCSGTGQLALKIRTPEEENESNAKDVRPRILRMD